MAIGQKLEEARNRKGISIREASESTKIRGDFLTSFESGNFDINLPEVYLRGFIRVYARFLGIDPESAVSDLSVEIGTVKNRSPKKTIGKIASQESGDSSKDVNSEAIRPSNITISQASQRLRILLWSAIIVGFSIIFVVILALIFSGDEKPNQLENRLGHDSSHSAIRETSIQGKASNVIFEDQLKEVPNNQNGSLLKLAAVGPIDRLIISDEGKTPKVFHEFKNLARGWETTISFTSSFRCYSSNLRNIRFAVNDGPEKQVNGEGAGNFSWKAE